CKEELGLVGITFHNAFQGVPIDSPLMLSLIEPVADAGLIPFVHAAGSPLETLYQVDTLAKSFPDLTMIVLDAFRDMNQVKFLPGVAARRLTLYVDLALLDSLEMLGLAAARAVGAHRFLSGTDQYSWPTMTRPYGCLLAGILDSELSDGDKAKILGNNARRIL